MVRLVSLCQCKMVWRSRTRVVASRKMLCLLVLILTVLPDRVCSLTLPRDSATERLLSFVPDDSQQLVLGSSESVDLRDKEPLAVRSDLNRHGVGSESADLGITVIGAVINRDTGGQDTNTVNGVEKEEELPPKSAPHDKEIDQNFPSTNSPALSANDATRWRLRRSSTTTPAVDEEEAADSSTAGVDARSDNNNGQTNGSITDTGQDGTGEGALSGGEADAEVAQRPQNPMGDVPEELQGRECILGSSDVYLAWWINNDGSLRKMDHGSGIEGDTVSNFIDMSGLGRSEGTLFYKLLQRLTEKRSIKFMSLARNNLDRAPYSSLSLINNTLEYLSLAGNNFGLLNASIIKDNRSDWATFPVLENLKELDLRSCRIAAIHEDAFREMQMLQKMYLANNNLLSLSSQIFSSVRNLVHLDLSYNSIEYSITNYFTNPFEWFTKGLEIDESAFANLTQLKFLDFSHTRLEPSSMKSFLYLPSKLEQLSLCYTAITVIGLGMFHNLPNLKVLDLSGNSALVGNLNEHTFDGLQNSLEILAFQHSSVKNLDWLGNLNSLKMLKLNENNINQLSKETLARLPSLSVLDLSDNHIGNWFTRNFEENTELSIVNLRSNNLNIITKEMMNDFSQLEYLGLANNKFICNCMLRDLIDQALQNASPDNGHGFQLEVPDITELLITQALINYLKNIGLEQVVIATREAAYDSYTRALKSYVSKGVESYRKIRTSPRALAATAEAISRAESRLRANVTLKNRVGDHRHLRYITESQAKRRMNKLKRTKRSPMADLEAAWFQEGEDLSFDYSKELNFNFQLMDFEEDYYTCFNATTNEEYFFTEIESCLLERVAAWQQLVAQLRPHQQRISVALYIIFVVMFIICIGYYKWWYLRYFFILIKNATILSFLNKESTDNGSRKSFGEISRSESYLYDVFVSYCDENRDWVINELLPNIEQRQEISICLHERDFVVGLSILENIIACMDRSKCLLLVVSQSFLLSQWCQFEMHLAQHRLLETCRERLVLILLEDIPKRKRPKTLGYLMKTKTYVKWPLVRESETSRSLAEERKIFWKRLRRALIESDWEPEAVA